ncbi:hypothetical protein EU527_16855 [Candidatus Thorarchaeota archaeon]|nr:MAG: hypothetical protein EU527_16855 [Candidatus Thorarchaeota archaeon]
MKVVESIMDKGPLQHHRRLRLLIAFIILGLAFSISPSSVYAATDTMTDQDNTTWIAVDQNYTKAIFSDVSFFNETHGWVVGQWTEGSSGNGIVLHTSDGGETWQTQLKNGTEQRYYRIELLSYDSVWVAGYSSLLHSTDGGLSWEEYPIVSSKSLMSFVKFINENIGWTATNTILYKTIDAGRNWTVVSGWTFDDNPLMFQFLSETEVWSIGFNGIYLSIDGAETWTQVYKYGGWAISMQDDGEGWAVSDAHLMHASNRTDWQIVSSPSHNPLDSLTLPYYSDILFIEENGWIVGRDVPILHTPDGGNTWFAQSVPSNIQRRLKALDFLNETYGWAVGYNGAILKTTRGTALGLRVWNGATDPMFLAVVFSFAGIVVIISGLWYRRRKKRELQTGAIQ